MTSFATFTLHHAARPTLYKMYGEHPNDKFSQGDEEFVRICNDMLDMCLVELREQKSKSQIIDYCRSLMGLIDDAAEMCLPSHEAKKKIYQKIINYREQILQEL